LKIASHTLAIGQKEKTGDRRGCEREILKYGVALGAGE